VTSVYVCMCVCVCMCMCVCVCLCVCVCMYVCTGAPGAKATGEEEEGSSELSGPDLLKREAIYLVACLTTLMSYKECLAIALQEGALDVIVALLRSEDKMLVHDALRCVRARSLALALSLPFCFSLSLSFSRILAHSLAHSLSLNLSLTHTHTLSFAAAIRGQAVRV